MPRTNITSLALRLESQVQSAVRMRGLTFFREGAVIQVGGDDASIHAEVRGSRVETVLVGPGETETDLDAQCTCPYFTDKFDICKHIWAVILYADRHRLLSDAREMNELVLVPDPRLSDRFQPWVSGPESGPRRPGALPWQYALRNTHRPGEPAPAGETLDPDSGRLWYLIEAPATPRGITVTVATRERRPDGERSKPLPRPVHEGSPQQAADPLDREILALLLGSNRFPHQLYRGSPTRRGARSAPHHGESMFSLRQPTEAVLLERMCRTGRCLLAADGGRDPVRLRWDDGKPWELRLRVVPGETEGTLGLEGRLTRGEESISLADPRLQLGNAVAILGDVAAPADLPGEGWIDLARDPEPIEVPPGDHDAFLEKILLLPGAPPFDLPADLHVDISRPDPVPLLIVDEPESDRASRLAAHLRFDYDGQIVRHGEPGSRLYERTRRRLVERDPEAEQEAASRLLDAGFRMPQYRAESDKPITVTARQFGVAVPSLLAEGWRVERQGKPYRSAGELRLEVSSGIDWFELRGSASFGDTRLELPELLRATRAGESFIPLADGSVGMIPEDWTTRYGLLRTLGTKHADGLRFSRTHITVLNALLETLPETRYDRKFIEARDRLAGAGIGPEDPPDTFQGELRDYQKEGLGWMRFLREIGFGGCLADDMGLGKTIQVLALLESLRRERSPQEPHRPSLVVVPRSVLWNWHDEAGKFTPGLRVRVHAGPERRLDLAECDVVLTTYATLHRDILKLKDVAFDTVVLDEAQAIKNPRTGRAKAARLLQARHRLALSGTPIENHLGELWSLFEFLNPGMLGSAAGFQKLLRRDEPEGAGDVDGHSLLARAVRPFILRRTKEQVAPELPERSEQTIVCEMKGPQLKRYRELRDHYRASLRQQVQQVGLNRSKMHVLEALLRLRQAACHPALIDPEYGDEEAAKIETLLPLLREILDEGHKALVFSQFTKFLALVRTHLDREKITYEYLDGRTRQREKRIARFQEDPDCPLFLISLKAGGLGLNLTEADYVFLLDPWWNPAVEAQAIDRAHRIGQTRHVFAYRLITRDTVEERILELQDAKRDLAASIITEDRSLMQKLRPEDLEVLLS